MAQAEGCPNCGHALTRMGSGPQWCPHCEWNLNELGEIEGWYLPREKRSIRRSHAKAFRQNRDLYAEFARQLPTPPGWSRVTKILVVVSAALLAFDVALAVAGIVLIASTQFFLVVIGVFLLLVAVLVRPRVPGQWWRREELTRQDAPELFALVDDVAEALGAPAIRHIVIDDDFNASCGRVGLRRRPALTIGMHLWLALSPPAKVALLGHELGHLVNGDADQSLVTQPVLTTFGQLADVVNPRHVDAQFFVRHVARVLLGPMWLLCGYLHYRIWRSASRDHMRAELYADVRGLELAGTDAAAEVETTLLLAEAVLTAMRRAARDGADVRGMLRAADAARATAAARLTEFEQLSLRTRASLYASHPPSGMRLRLVRAWPRTEGTLRLGDERNAAIDAELTGAYGRARRAMLLEA